MSKQNESEEVDAVLMGDHPGVDEVPDSELIFRAQHKLRDLIEDHWRGGVAVIATGLLATLIYGVTINKKIEAQEAAVTMIAQLDRSMPSVSDLSLQGIFPLDEPSDERRAERLEAIAERYEAHAADSAGAASAASWNRSGAIWLRLETYDRAESAFRNALIEGGLYGIAANNGLAAAAVAQGDLTAAITHLTEISDGNHGSMSETALINLSRVARQSGDIQAARTALQRVITDYPLSSRLDRVTWELQTIDAMSEDG
jgi:tetratricopeptide (TPR) repeat protein